jgi:hypothetical protein
MTLTITRKQFSHWSAIIVCEQGNDFLCWSHDKPTHSNTSKHEYIVTISPCLQFLLLNFSPISCTRHPQPLWCGPYQTPSPMLILSHDNLDIWPNVLVHAHTFEIMSTLNLGPMSLSRCKSLCHFWLYIARWNLMIFQVFQLISIWIILL